MENAKKRKSFVLAPQTPIASSIVDLNDDARETEERKNLRQKKTSDTPSGRESTQSVISTGRAKLAKMTATEKSEHAEKCIQLSAANKISVKNAFSLLLIDQMVELVKNEEASFQVASTHLDASAKIYAARVDKVHADVLRFAGGLMSKKPRDPDQDGEKDDEEEDDASPAGEDGVAVLKPKKKRRARTVILKDPKTLMSAAHLRGVNIGDLFLQQLLTSQEASEPGNSHFLLTLPISGDQYKMQLRGDGIEFPPMCPELPSECAARMPDLRACLPLPLLPTEIHSMLVEGDAEGSQIRISPLYLPPPDPEEDDDMPADDFAPDDFADHDDGDGDAQHDWIKTTEVRAGGQMENGAGAGCFAEVGASQTTERLLMPQDYMNLHRAALGLSMGPRDWKPMRAKPSAVLRPAAAKLQRSRIRSELDFEYCDGLWAEFKDSNRTEFSDATIVAWRRNFHHMPQFDSIKGKRFQNFWLLYRTGPKIVQDAENRATQVNGLDNGSHVVDLDSSFSKFVFAADSDHDDHNDMGMDDDMDDAEALAATGYSADTAPELQPLNYAKRAKGIDMRMLKRCTWELIRHSHGDKENSANKITFEDIYSHLPAKLSSKMATNLSPALAFMAVLHLANEHSLELINSEDLTTLYIHSSQLDI